MYTLQQNRITFRRMFRLAGLLLGMWLINSLFSPLWSQTIKNGRQAKDKVTSCYINRNGLNITLALNEPLAVTVRLFTLLGEETATLCRHKITDPGTHSSTYALPYLKPGIYFCAVEVGSTQYVHKLCVP
jgi:hypothetical protein